MRRILSIAFFLLMATVAIGQPGISENSIEIEGYARIAVQPSFYTAIISIQETEQKIGYTTIGKTPIDSIKLFMAEALKKRGIDSKDLKLIGTSIRDLYGGQLQFSLQSITYAYNLANKEQAENLFNGLRFAGLKGILVTWTTTEERKGALRDSLYELALRDAQKTAERLAAKVKKTVGEVKAVTVFSPDMTRLDKDIQPYDLYNNFRFENDNRDLYIKGTVRATFELK